MEDRRVHRLIVVPRAHYAKYHPLPYAEVLAAAERGDDGLTVTNSKDYGAAYFREGDKGGMLEGRASLFFQGWVA